MTQRVILFILLYFLRKKFIVKTLLIIPIDYHPKITRTISYNAIKLALFFNRTMDSVLHSLFQQLS